jgi:hypothetical protein
MPGPAARGSDWQRVQARLAKRAAEPPPVEVRFSLADQWSRQLFVALLRRQGNRPYRYRGQRRTTLMAPQSRSFGDATLGPEFLERQGTLSADFDALSDRVIEQALEVKAGEAEERRQSTPLLPPHNHPVSLLVAGPSAASPPRTVRRRGVVAAPQGASTRLLLAAVLQPCPEAPCAAFPACWSPASASAAGDAAQHH